MRERDDGVRQGRSWEEDRRSSDVDGPETDLNLLNGFVDSMALHERHDGEEHGALEGRDSQLLHSGWMEWTKATHRERSPESLIHDDLGHDSATF